MQAICDAISVLGSRHGLLLDPTSNTARVLRFDPFQDLPALSLRAGVRSGDGERVFPFCAEGPFFEFVDQRITPCASRWIGLVPEAGLKVVMEWVSPFRPRDAAFSTTPVLGLRLWAEKLPGNYRWTPVSGEPFPATLFVEFGGEAMTLRPSGEDALDLEFVSRTGPLPQVEAGNAEALPQRDRLVCVSGDRKERGFEFRVSESGGGALELFWCTHSGPVLEVMGDRCPFRYAETFADLEAVCDWARSRGSELFANAERVAARLESPSLSACESRLLSYTLHSWLANTWWVRRPDGRESFSVWEGICHFHSTVDVEFTQSPFYLSLWPELLGIQLRTWPEYAKPGEGLLGAAGEGTRFLSHDCGQFARMNGQVYPHEMEVEETVNYLILLYAHWRRSGDGGIVREQEPLWREFLAFLVACDSSGNGVPDLGIANTLDDASPAIQYGREQVYLAVKTLAAFRCGAEMLDWIGDAAEAECFRDRAEALRALIEDKGWLGDHYATLLDKRTEGVVNPWTGATLKSDEVPGWDGCHLFTENAFALLDMVGMDTGLDPVRVAEDLRTAARRCLKTYGCAHTDYAVTAGEGGALMDGMVGVGGEPGWISMNMLRDLAAEYRGVTLPPLAERYWEWQVTTNTQQACLFFETFGGNNLCFYPRGIAIWGLYDARAGRVIDQVAGVRRERDTSIPDPFSMSWIPAEAE